MHPRMDNNGNVREYIINPYQIAATNGRYYMICNYDKYDNVSNYRIDRITDIKLLDTPIKQMKQVEGLQNGLNLLKHMAENVYMFGGESETVKFIAKKYLINDIIDWFGTDVEFSDETENDVTVRVNVSRHDMRKWAVQYAPHTKIISPQALVDEVTEDIKIAMKNYGIEV